MELEDHARRIVRRASELLKKDFFVRAPDEIIDIWLFKDEKSYKQYTMEIFGHEPFTPYGYYLYEENAIIINAATGGGTLVHEIVHTFIDANFPDCPAWFDEGFASLFEKPTTSRGHIKGLVNWRLPELKEAIRRGRLPSFDQILSISNEDFYNKDSGTNYSQVKYLLYYLQQKELLVDFYHSFYENRRRDPFGTKTLGRILGRDNMRSFQADWEQWVMSINYE